MSNDITALMQRLVLAAAKGCCQTLLPDDCRALVEALVEALEKAQWNENLTEAERQAYLGLIRDRDARIAEQEDAEQKLCAANVTLDARAEHAERRLAELEKAASEPVAWTEKCEITNMRATGLYLRGFPDNSQGRDIALYTVSPTLESRTVTVKLPERYSCELGYPGPDPDGELLDRNDVIEILNAAGINVEAE